MKRLLLFFVLLLVRDVYGLSGETVDVVNVGTNQVSAGFSYNAPDNSSGGQTILPGTTWHTFNGDTVAGHTYYISWGPVGGPKIYSMAVGTTTSQTGYQDFGHFPVSANGTPTNCYDYVTISNTSNARNMYQLTLNGSPYGVVFVDPGASPTFQFPNPNCNTSNQYSFTQIYSFGGLSQFGPPQTVSELGGTLYANQQATATSTGPVSSVTASPTQDANNHPNAPVINSASSPIAKYTNIFDTANTNGGIVFGTNSFSSPTNAANNGTIQQGANAIYQATVDSSKSVVSAIQSLQAENAQGHAGTSNAIAVLAGALGGMTNGTGGSVSNLPGLETNLALGQLNGEGSNAVTSMLSATNGASALGFGGFTNAVGTKLGTDLGLSGGGVGFSAVTLPGTPSVTLAVGLPTGLETPISVLSSLCEWTCYFWLFISTYRLFVPNIRAALATPQAGTAGEEVLGTNLNFGSALVVAGLIVGVVVVLVSVGLSSLGTFVSQIPGNPFSGMMTLPGSSFVASCVPLSVIGSCIVSHVMFRLVIDSATVVTMGVIKFLVGL